LTGLEKSVLKIKTKIVSCHTADSKPVKQEVNCTVILPLLVFPGRSHLFSSQSNICSKGYAAALLVVVIDDSAAEAAEAAEAA
jgi:hypothetical protein